MSHDNTLASPMTDDLFDAPLFGGEVATPILSALKSPSDLKSASIADLQALAREIREVICNLSKRRSIHFASNLGVVELTIALHYAFDFAWDRLVWDVGHQCYPHKLLTGRFDQFETLRTKGGLSGYPNPSESEYDLFMTGHAGTSVGTALGLAVGDLLAGCLETASTESSTPLELDASPASARRVNRTRTTNGGGRWGRRFFERSDLRSAQSRGRPSAEDAGRSQRQQDVNLQAGRRIRSLPGSFANDAKLPWREDAHTSAR